MNTEIKELVVYTIKESEKDSYQKVQHLVKSCLEDMEGFKHVQSFRSCTQATQLMDWVSWETLDHAKGAQKAFEKHPQHALLMQYIKEMKFFDHFKN